MAVHLSREIIQNIVFGEENIFMPELEWLQRLIDRPHGKGLERCYRQMGERFRGSELPVNRRLEMLRAGAPAINYANASHGSRSSYLAAQAVIEAVDGTPGVDYHLANQVLDMLEPAKALKRYPV